MFFWSKACRSRSRHCCVCKTLVVVSRIRSVADSCKSCARFSGPDSVQNAEQGVIHPVPEMLCSEGARWHQPEQARGAGCARGLEQKPRRRDATPMRTAEERAWNVRHKQLQCGRYPSDNFEEPSQGRKRQERSVLKVTKKRRVVSEWVRGAVKRRRASARMETNSVECFLWLAS